MAKHQHVVNLKLAVKLGADALVEIRGYPITWPRQLRQNDNNGYGIHIQATSRAKAAQAHYLCYTKHHRRPRRLEQPRDMPIATHPHQSTRMAKAHQGLPGPTCQNALGAP